MFLLKIRENINQSSYKAVGFALHFLPLFYYELRFVFEITRKNNKNVGL